MTSRGVLLFAYDNAACDYHRMVPVTAWFVKRHLGVPVVVVTDEPTREKIRSGIGPNLVDDFIVIPHEERNGLREYNIAGSNHAGEFRNKTRTNMYDISPFDETIYMDLDYLVMDDRLSLVWGSDAPVRVNRQMASLIPNHRNDQSDVHPLGISMYWSTVVYFRKCPESEAFFHGVDYIKRNYQYFSHLYGFGGSLFRNDVAISIMAHCANGGSRVAQPVVQSLPDPTLLFAWDDQPLVHIDEDRAWFSGSVGGAISPRVIYVREQSIHIVNKESVIGIVLPWVAKQLGVGV